MRLCRRLFCLFALLPLAALPACAGEAVLLHPQRPDQTRIGALSWRGGIVLDFPEAGGRFGGLSALEISTDGSEALVLSDRGRWFRLRLDYDERGSLAGAELAAEGSLLGPDGKALSGVNADAEGMTRLADGSTIVSFEQRHRLLRYPPGEPPFARTPALVPPPPGVEAAPANEGIEAIAALPDGRMVAFAEGLRATAAMGYAWLGDGQNWTPMSWTLTRSYVPVGAAALPDGDLLVLERRFDLGGLASRLSRIEARTLRRGAPITGTELARLEPPYISNNFEGVAVRRGPRGQSLVYLVSDDNFAPTLRTLLVMFEIVE